MNECEPYNWLNFKRADCQSLIHSINLQGKDLIGLELGIFTGNSFCTMLQNCPNIKTLHGVDSWQPYTDYLFAKENGPLVYDEKQIEFVKLQAYHNIKFSGFPNKAIVHEKDSNKVVDEFEDEYFDFMFIDTYLSEEQAYNDFVAWYPKLKKGGLFMGHDWDSEDVQHAVINFRSNHNINKMMSVFDSAFIWKK